MTSAIDTLAAGSVLAQAQPGPFDMLLPFILIIPIFYLLIIRPQNKRMKEHKTMLEGVKKGDTIVTSGGVVGKVTKVKDGDLELEVEIAKDVRVTVVRSTIADVRVKGEPKKAEAA